MSIAVPTLAITASTSERAASTLAITSPWHVDRGSNVRDRGSNVFDRGANVGDRGATASDRVPTLTSAMARAPNMIRGRFVLGGEGAQELARRLGLGAGESLVLPLPPHVDVHGKSPTAGQLVPTEPGSIMLARGELVAEGLWADTATSSFAGPAFTLVSPDLDALELWIRTDDRDYPVGDEIHIGRASTVAIAHRDVSRRHARIMREGAGHVLVHLGEHPTLVNGAPVDERCSVGAGDRIEIGPATLRLETAPAAGAWRRLAERCASGSIVCDLPALGLRGSLEILAYSRRLARLAVDDTMPGAARRALVRPRSE
jgi:FHA domain